MAMGRPVVEIDWDMLDNLIIAQCKVTETAGYFGITDETLNYKMFEKYGETFSVYSTKLHRKGKSMLKARQFNRAFKDGNVQMLIKLGDIYLDEFKQVNSELANPQSIETLLESVTGTSKDLVNDTV